MKILNKTSNLNIKNKGFSLIELIVVIAIMVVFTAIVVISSSVIDSSRVKEAERGIDDYVSLARSKSMSVSAKSWYMELTTEDGEYVTKLCMVEEVDDGGVNVEKTIDVDRDTYSSKISVSFKDDTTSYDIDNEEPLRIYFSPSTGKVSKITVGVDNADISSGIGHITINSQSYSATLKFFYNTGKIERE